MTAECQSTLRNRLLALLIAGIGGLAATAISFAMAVYDAANPDPVAIVAPGKAIDTGRWIITPERAFSGSVPPTGIPSPDPKTYVMLEFELENRSAASSYASMNLFALDPPVPGLKNPVVHLARDSWIASPIHPGMPEKMVIAWEWPAGKPVPHELRLLIGSQFYKRRDNLYGASGWFNGDPAAVVALPVESEQRSQ